MLAPELDRWVDDFRTRPEGDWLYFAYEQLGGS